MAPGAHGADPAIDATLARLGAHGPSRTLVMRRHGADRLDVEAMLEVELPDGAGRLGVCHDQVVSTADESRLEHAASLVAPLLLADLPTVLWLRPIRGRRSRIRCFWTGAARSSSIRRPTARPPGAWPASPAASACTT